jgi:hypothetical protein
MAIKDEKTSKIRVLVFELEGSNDTIQEGLRALSATLGRTVVAPRVVSSAKSNANNVMSAPIIEAEEVIDDEESIEEVSQSSRSPRKKRVARTPDVLELDLKSGSVSFEDFAIEKAPKSDAEKYLLIAYWLKENLEITQIGIGHIYTCLRAMKWKVQADIGQPLRSAKKVGTFRSVGHGEYEITHIGIGAVEKIGL